MSIANVTDTTFDHSCEHCGKAEQAILHARLELKQRLFGPTLSYVSCEEHTTTDPHFCSDETCTIHTECFNLNLKAADEIDPARSPAGREQVRQVRLLCQHLGLPVK